MRHHLLTLVRLFPRGKLFAAALAMLLSCSPPTGVDPKPALFHSQVALPTSQSTRERMLGCWEVTAVGGKPLESVSEDDIPFRLLRINADGHLQMDTFQTEYEVAGEKADTI